MSDLYTKSILTIIASCLVLIVARDIGFIPEAHAQMRGPYVASDVQKVSICNPGGDKCGDSWIQYVRKR